MVMLLLVHRNQGKLVGKYILKVNINKYEQTPVQPVSGDKPFQCGSVGRTIPFYFSSHHWFSLRTWWSKQVFSRSCLKAFICFCSLEQMVGINTWASSSSVKSFLMLNVFLISSGVLPLIMLATVLQVTSNRPLMSK